MSPDPIQSTFFISIVLGEPENEPLKYDDYDSRVMKLYRTKRKINKQLKELGQFDNRVIQTEPMRTQTIQSDYKLMKDQITQKPDIDDIADDEKNHAGGR